MDATPTRALGTDEVEALAAELEAKVASGTWIMAGDPLRQADWEVVVTEVGLWDGREGLARLLSRTGEGAMFGLTYEVDDDGGSRRFTGGFEIPGQLSEQEYEEIAEGADVGFGISGTQFYLFDATMRWVIITALDVQLTAGEPELVEAYFGSPEARHEAVEDYRLFASQPGILPVYEEMGALNRPRRDIP